MRLAFRGLAFDFCAGDGGGGNGCGVIQTLMKMDCDAEQAIRCS
jgi:hypothetical protein